MILWAKKISKTNKKNKTIFSRLTCLLDKGVPLSILESYLDAYSKYIRIAKLGWGTCLIDNKLADRIKIYESYDIKICPGGTLFELFYKRDKKEDYLNYIKKNNFTACEISDGTIDINFEEKLNFINSASKDFFCLSEVGSKDPDTIVAPNKWCKQIKDELNAGADLVILEGRESSNAGIYRGSGELRKGLIEEILDSGIKLTDLIFEANNKANQVEILKLYGENVNFGNICFDDVLPLETLRLGIRSDTLNRFNYKLNI